ncbi:MAG: PorT family protein [Flavobacteriaceae bacterium]|nr:PorT family protein [Flavobacteriaceae bacterium]
MKKTLLLVVISLSLSISAQKSKKEEGITFGLKGGLNVSNFAGDIKDNSIRTSVHLGVFSEIMISDKFSLQPELLYSGQGYSGSAMPGFSRSKYDYINLPVLAKIYIAEKISIEAGPQIGFLVSAKQRTTDDNDKISDQKTVDFGLNFGLAYDLKNGIFFQTRYNLGLSNVNSGSNANAIKFTNSVIQVSVGIKL